MNVKDVSVVICTQNNKDNIKRVIKSVLKENPGEVVVVDGHSTDGTRDIVLKMGVKVISDPGKGLAKARQIGLNEVSNEYVLFVGDDNVLAKGSILKLKQYMLERDWIGAAFQTRIWHANKDYWSYCANWRWRIRFCEGERDVIGTPYMYYTDILKKAGYDEECSVSDDSDIDKRISELTDKKYGYANIICYEIGKTGLGATISRFTMYGKSDYQFWKKYSKEWTIKRKIKSIRHPIDDEFIKPLGMINSFKTKVYVFPYFFVITCIRYYGWIKELIKNR